MNVALRRTTMTIEEFLAWEDRQERKYEFDGFRPVAMAGGTAAHAAIARNLLFVLTGALRGKSCQPFGSDLKIAAAGSIRYPDAFVCTPVPANATVVTDPVIVFEVASPSTSHTDAVTKNAEYRATPSIQRYVLLQQTLPGATVFSRKGEDWLTDIVAGDEAMLRLPEIGVEIPLADVYESVELDEPG